MRETRLGHRLAHNLVRRGHNMRAKIPLTKKRKLKAMSVTSRYDTITTQLIEEFLNVYFIIPISIHCVFFVM